MTGFHTLTNAHGASATILPFVATLVELCVPDRMGTLDNVVLGLDDPDAYPRQNVFLGAICARVANRIRNARFTLGGVTSHLDANDPPHHLHGGARGWYRAHWAVAPEETERAAGRGIQHLRHAGICLETQAFPDAINVPDWRSQVLLHPGDTYRRTVVYAFSID